MRLVSLSPATTEILFSLGLGSRIIAVTTYCDYPPAATRLPKVGSWITAEFMKIKALNPDMIFTSYYQIPTLQEAFPNTRIVHTVPKTLFEVKQSILTIGEITNSLTKARKIVEKMEREFEQISQNTEKIFSPLPMVSLPRRRQNRTIKQSSATVKFEALNLKLEIKPTNQTFNGANNKGLNRRSLHLHSRPRVYMEEWPVPPFVSGNWVPELVQIAGGIPIIAETGKPSKPFSPEALHEDDPDVMIFHWCGYKTRFSRKMVIDRPGWKNLKAIQKNKLFTVDDSLLNRPGPRLIEGTREIQKLLLNARNLHRGVSEKASGTILSS